jgi:hypothetical protein
VRVMYRGKLLPRFFFERDPTTVATKPRCLECFDTGKILEQIDDDRPLEVVPCPGCHMFCTRCDKHVLREGHKCS